MRFLVLALLVGCGPKGPVVAAGSQPVVPAGEVAPPRTKEAPVAEPMTHDWIDVPRYRVTAGDLELAVFDTGGDGEPVVFVHGMGSTSAFWQQQLTGGRLEGYRLVALDLPGWGDSSQPDAAYTPSFYAKAVLAAMDALGLERAHVVAHSMGGQAAIVLTVEPPERVRSLTLSAPAGVETFTPEEGTAIRAFWASQDLANRTEDQARVGYQFAFARWDDDVEKLLQARMALAGTEQIDGLVRATRSSVDGMLDEPVIDRLGELSVPVAYVWKDMAVLMKRGRHGGVPLTCPERFLPRAILYGRPCI